jgi:lysylphosphatidylglycerol synthetase-like protein (DUF2156 family)
LLVYEALRQLAADGYKLATLGTSPLAPDGSEVAPDSAHPALKYALRLAYRRLTPVYNFAGLRRFKAKFVPSWWESEYAVAPAGASIPPQVAYAVLRAVRPGGVRNGSTFLRSKTTADNY